MLFSISRKSDDFITGVEEFGAGFDDAVNSLDAGHLLGVLGVEADQLGMRVWTAKDGSVQHPRECLIERVFGAAGRLFGSVETRDARAEQAPFLGP
jgi:hypothetical protein